MALASCAHADEPDVAKPEAQALAPSQPPTPAASTAAPGRLVAIGDLHADLDNAIQVLQLSGLTDASGKWIGGDATLVQTGDTTDRGPDSKAIIDLIRALIPQAETAGGRVVSLLGNHEVMNLMGDWRYVAPSDVAQFGGLEARKKAFALEGSYGSWLFERDVVAEVDGNIFVHGGVTPAFAKMGVQGMNDAARQAIRDQGGSVLESDGPLWFRDYVNAPESSACPLLAQSLASLNAKRMVVGHTTRSDGKVESRCGGRLLVIDIGIADHYGANLGAIELTDDDARALYPSGTVDLVDPS